MRGTIRVKHDTTLAGLFNSDTTLLTNHLPSQFVRVGRPGQESYTGGSQGDPRLIPDSGSRVRNFNQGLHAGPNQRNGRGVLLVYLRDWDVRMQADMI